MRCRMGSAWSATIALTLMLAIAPSAAQARLAKAIWGPETRNGVNQFPMYRQLGVSIYEIELDWSQVAPTQPANPSDPNDPAYTWPKSIQTAISEAGLFHMRVLVQVINAPEWANGGHSGLGWAPQRPNDFVAFVQAAARAYPSVHLWMIWGEPTKTGNFQPSAYSPPGAPLSPTDRAAAHLYARILDGAYGALKKISKRNVVIGGCTYTTGAIDTYKWITNLRLPNHRVPRMDMYAHNPFSYTEPTFHGPPSPFDEVQFSDLPRLAKFIDKHLHRGLPLFLSEWTIPTAPDDEFNFWVDPPVAGRWVTDAFKLARGWHRIYALGWVNVYDSPPRTAGGLLTARGKPKPSFYAFKRG